MFYLLCYYVSTFECDEYIFEFRSDKTSLFGYHNDCHDLSKSVKINNSINNILLLFGSIILHTLFASFALFSDLKCPDCCIIFVPPTCMRGKGICIGDSVICF